MEKPSRDAHVQRLQAFLEDALDYLYREWPEDFDLGAVGIAFEVLTEAPFSEFLKRSDAGYTPDDDVNSSFTYWCSDSRAYVQAAMFRYAFEWAEDKLVLPSTSYSSDGQEDGNEEESEG